jgi:hypothetical protein
LELAPVLLVGPYSGVIHTCAIKKIFHTRKCNNENSIFAPRTIASQRICLGAQCGSSYWKHNHDNMAKKKKAKKAKKTKRTTKKKGGKKRRR